ncbi:ABC transporter [Bradyrhizobium sp. LTSP885]|uniref:amino acid ABC transporter substrate-binding protein n=1 Tax=Bradyrhizobium sp. LTSP885 TaxID=1619232 RepID=UPI0005CA1D73|nr:amino acid ABC transporter substrate-binding protein [Bradyrhizobium sp. LTSP885]KJC46737.1 ABC transporter [Bradyrhizobium sp. LTSP885]
MGGGTFKKLIYLAFVSLLSIAAARAEPPSETLDKIASTGVLTIGHRDTSIPFSYFDDAQHVVGFSIDLCARVVDQIKVATKRPDLQVKYVPVTSATRIPLLANGTIDIECGSTTNTIERQTQVAFSSTTYLTTSNFVSKKAAAIRGFDDLKGRTVVSTAGTTSLRLLNELNVRKELGMQVVPAKDHAEAFLMVATDRASAFVMDDVLLAGQVANARDAESYQISQEFLSVEPYAIMMRRGDLGFKQLVDSALADMFRSGDFDRVYRKWFETAIPPRSINLNLPMSAALKKVVAHPSDSADTASYQ